MIAQDNPDFMEAQEIDMEGEKRMRMIAEVKDTIEGMIGHKDGVIPWLQELVNETETPKKDGLLWGEQPGEALDEQVQQQLTFGERIAQEILSWAATSKIKETDIRSSEPTKDLKMVKVALASDTDFYLISHRINSMAAWRAAIGVGQDINRERLVGRHVQASIWPDRHFIDIYDPTIHLERQENVKPKEDALAEILRIADRALAGGSVIEGPEK